MIGLGALNLLRLCENSSGADNKVVILNLTLYKVQQGIYLLDFHKVKGELFPVSDVNFMG